MVEKKLSEIRIRRSQYTEDILKVLWELDPTLKDRPTATFQRGVEALIREHRNRPISLTTSSVARETLSDKESLLIQKEPISETPVEEVKESDDVTLNEFEKDLLDIGIG